MSRLLITALALSAAIPIPAQTKGVARDAPASWGFDASGMDRGVTPGDDFFAYANGDWVQRIAIPNDRATVGLFADLDPVADARVRGLLDAIDPHQSVDSQTGKLRALYQAFLDERTVEARGMQPLKSNLDRIAAARDREDLADLMGQAHSGFGASIFDIDLATDSKHSDRYAVYLGQSGLGLPDRDYYLQPRFAPKLDAYTHYATRLLALAGWSDPARQARDLVAFEARIAGASWTRESVRDPLKTYNPRTLADLERQVPSFAWGRFLDGAGLTRSQRLVATTDTSLPRIADLFAGTPIDTVKAWLAFRTADAASPYLSDAFVQARRDFRTVILAGQPSLSPRWQRGVHVVNEAMGSAAGELYVQHFFQPDSQTEIMALVDHIRSALAKRIDAASWMSAETRQEALRKLARLEVQVGRPRAWIDYDALVVRPDDLYGNVVRARAFDWHRRILQLASPWNKSDWRFWPQDPTAYTENGQLIFTAAMLQFPFFDPKADAAVNYGAIGSVIGHELSHQFDDQGRMDDADGQLRDWWKPADVLRFQTQAARLSKQYSSMQPLPGLHVKGDLTLGENIADLGGVSIALAAYHLSLGAHPAPVIDGFTGNQRFFLSWAQAWRQKSRDDELRRLVASNVHSPPVERVNGVVRNMDEWYAAWHVRPRQRLYVAPVDRVRIW